MFLLLDHGKLITWGKRRLDLDGRVFKIIVCMFGVKGKKFGNVCTFLLYNFEENSLVKFHAAFSIDID